MEQGITKATQLQERILSFAAEIIRYIETLRIPRTVADQLTRSASSVGANYAEALNASSKTDFRNKIYIAKKEAAETKYWLQLIERLQPKNANNMLIQECQSILMILQKTVNTINGQRKINGQ